MARVGELLVAAGLLTQEQVEQALHAQVMWGGRLGTNLVELGFVDLDPLAQALGRQHKIPAALARHFERSDPALQRLLTPELAEKYAAVPLVRVNQRVALALVEPIEALGLRRIAADLEVEVEQLVPSIAPELRIRYHLERVYGIPRTARFLRSRGKTNPPFPHLEIQIDESEPDLSVPDIPIETPNVPTDTQMMPSISIEGLSEEPPPPVVSRTASREVALDVEALIAKRAAEPAPEPVAEPPPFVTLPPPFESPRSSAGSSGPQKHAKPEVSDNDATTRLVFKGGSVVPVAPPEERRDTEAGADVEEPEIEVEPAADLDDLSSFAELDESPEPPVVVGGRDRRKYVRSITDVPTTDSERQALGRIAIRKVAVKPAGTTLGEATRAIRRSTDRDRVADLAMGTLERFMPECHAAIILVVRGELAIGWKGFCRGGLTLPEIGVPLDQPSVVLRAIERTQTVRLPSSELTPVDRLLAMSLGQEESGADLGVAPVTIGGQVMCLIAFVASPEGSSATADSVAAAAGAAFARLMRDASR